ncbi:MAG: ADP-ribosylglycohydrolase family protein [Bacteroidia bacterium]
MTTSPLLGAVIGDIIGSRFEWNNVKTTEFELYHPACDFTDDSVMTFAVADALLHGRPYGPTMHTYGRAYPGRGYGGNFRKWLLDDDPEPYDSYGNGSAMRVSPVGWAFQTLEETLRAARETAMPSHDHPEGIKGAEATAAAVFLARTGASKADIGGYITAAFGYDLSQSLDDLRPDYRFDVTCQGSVPPAVRAFLESSDYESAIRLAISIGGDSDTLACIAGGIAAAFYGAIPAEAISFARNILPAPLNELADRFATMFVPEA